MKFNICRKLTIVMLIALFSVPLFGAMIRLKAIQFDTKNGEPGLPAQLTIREAETNYYIVQFNGPIQEQWKQELRTSNVQVISYLPDYAYLVRMDQYARELVAEKPSVTWIGLYQPAYKVHPDLWTKPGLYKVAIVIHDTEELSSVVVRILATGAQIIDVSDCVGKLVVAEITSSILTALANIEGIAWIEYRPPVELHNNLSARWLHSGAAGDTTIWSKGLRGDGQILGTTDSGITTAHWSFYHSAYPITNWGSFPNHRKIVNYSRGGSSVTFGDHSVFNYHGTHTAGTVAGNDSFNSGTSLYDGIAKNAKLSFCDVGNSGGFLSIWTNVNQLWDTNYAYGARIVSNSWGSNTYGDYDTYDAQTDQFMWRRKTCLIMVSAGNAGSGAGSTGSPGNAKDALTLGAVGRLDPTAIASYSSRGMTDDNRYKPTVMSPGGLNTGGDPGLYSADGGTSGAGSNYQQMSGTSMASPSACGALGLIREYLNKGYYPTGAAVPGNAIPNPSNALLKAMAVVSTDPNITGFTVPDNDIGWGRIDLDSVLYFTDETRRLLLHDSATGGLNTNDSIFYSWNVSSAIPLRVTLCWTDTAGNPSAARSQVNDLDLRVIDPSNASYWGNRYSGGQSATGGSRDSNNVEENFRLNAPASGLWRAVVRGRNVPTGANQTYAIVITGAVSNLGIGIFEDRRTAITTPELNITSPTVVNRELNYSIFLPRSDRVMTTIYNSLGARAYHDERSLTAGIHKHMISLAGLSQGVYFLVLEASDQTRVNKIILVE